jgi:hypothetical protein
MPPQDQRVLESGSSAQAILKRGGGGNQPGELSADQGARIGPGPVVERELDHQLRSDVPDVIYRHTEPGLRRRPAGRGDLAHRAGSPPAGLLFSCHPDQAQEL